MSNQCIRCGNQRIASRSWTEVVEIYGRKSSVTHSEFVCSNKECQEIVDKQFEVQKQKRIVMEAQKEQDKVDRAKRMSDARR